MTDTIKMYLNWRKTLANPERFEIFLQNLSSRSNRYTTDCVEYLKSKSVFDLTFTEMRMKEVLMIADRLYDEYSPSYKASTCLIISATIVSSCVPTKNFDLSDINSRLFHYYTKVALHSVKRSFIKEILDCINCVLSRENVDTLEKKCLADALAVYDMRIGSDKTYFTDIDIRNLTMFTDLGAEIKHGYISCLDQQV